MMLSTYQKQQIELGKTLYTSSDKNTVVYKYYKHTEGYISEAYEPHTEFELCLTHPNLTSINKEIYFLTSDYKIS